MSKPQIMGGWKKIDLSTKNQTTPFLLIDLDIVEKNFNLLKKNFPSCHIHYAVKANSNIDILKKLKTLNCKFEIASGNELKLLEKIHIHPTNIIFGNTIKKPEDIKLSKDYGIEVYACDSLMELDKINQYAPKAKVYFRLCIDGSGSDWPLSKKFGSHPDIIEQLLKRCKKLSINPLGFSFHVGSQQRDIGQWESALLQCRELFAIADALGYELNFLNIGGGLPSDYLPKSLSIKTYLKEIKNYLNRHFKDKKLELVMEPGRSLVGNAGVIISEVLLNAKKSKIAPVPWIYLDIGVFGGLIETLGESIRYPIYTRKRGKKIPVILAGPTCDSMDIIYQNTKYELPANLKMGDKVYFFSTGAYTSSYSSVNFNGFAPLKTLVM